MIYALTMLCDTATAAASDGDLISGKVIVALFSAIFAAGGGIWIGKGQGRKEGVAEAERRHVSGSVRAEVPQPLVQEQSPDQASWKANEHDHENLFGRVAKCERDIARIEAKADATYQYIEKQLDTLTQMITQLFERICQKKKG